MGWGRKNLMLSPLFMFVVTLRSYLITLSQSQSIIKSLPGYHGDLPFKFETGYVGVGEKEEVELFYYFVESERNPEEDPLIFHIPGGPGVSGLVTLTCELGPLSLNVDNGIENPTITLNPYSWTKFLINHPKFLKNPLYIMGMSYTGIVTPIVTLELYEGNERGDQPTLNIQGYILCSPLTNKFMDINSRLEYAHRMALISDDIYKLAIENCDGNYVNIETANGLCVHSLQRYEQCTSQINIEYTLEPPCDELDPMPYCLEYYGYFLHFWANSEVVQQALNIRQGTIGKWEPNNKTMHYSQGKNDTFCYAYDIFSSFAYHKKLASKNCRALIFSGDHDMTFPYVGVEQWIASLGIRVEIPWNPLYVDDQVGGYETTYAQNDFSLTFATVKGAGHIVPMFKPKESMDVLERWLASRTYSSNS